MIHVLEAFLEGGGRVLCEEFTGSKSGWFTIKVPGHLLTGPTRGHCHCLISSPRTGGPWETWGPQIDGSLKEKKNAKEKKEKSSPLDHRAFSIDLKLLGCI